MESGGSETSESGVPSTLEGTYELRDASATSEERDHHQEHVHRLRGEEYRSRAIRFDESAQHRERSRAEALRGGGEDPRRPWWPWILGGGSEERSEKRGLRASFRGTGVPGGGGKALPHGFGE